MSGAELLADALREMLDDNQDDDRPHRAQAYAGQITIRELPLETSEDYANWRTKAREAARRAIDEGQFLIWLGGNHLSVLPLYEELAGKKDATILQLDAHLDLYHLRECKSELSHGNFLRHLDPPPIIINVGHRDLFLPKEDVECFYRTVFSAADVTSDENEALALIRKSISSAGKVFVDIDVDVLDPTFFPAVNDALPFGLNPQQLLKIVGAIGKNQLAGLAISEFDPGRDLNDRSLSLLIWLVEYILLQRYESP